MPCSDGGPSREDIEREHHRQRGLAVGLCIACATLEQHGILPPELRAWYSVHRAADDNRDWKDVAWTELKQAEEQARAQGFNGLGFDHPLRKRYNDAYHKLNQAETLERIESAKLSALKPESR